MKMNYRTESDLLRACKSYLTVAELAGNVSHWDRLNSGSMVVGTGRARRFIKLCKKGTPDLMVVLTNGTVLWVECKVKDNTLSPEQVMFSRKMSRVPGHVYAEIRSVEELIDIVDPVRGKRI